MPYQKRKLLLPLLVCGLAASACSQEIPSDKVPSVVQNGLQARFADALQVNWEMQDKHFEAEFTLAGSEYEVLLDAQGNLLMVKQDIALSELPVAIKDAISREFSNYRVEDPERLEHNNQVYYQVELEKRLSEKKLVFEPDGRQARQISYWD